MHGTKSTPKPDLGIEDAPLLYTLKEAAEQLRVTERYVYMLIERDELPACKFGNSRRVRSSDLSAFVDRLVEEERELRKRVRSAA